MAPTSNQVPTVSAGPRTEALTPNLSPPTEAPASVAPSNANSNAKIQEQVKVVINDLAKKLHGKPADKLS